MYRRSTGRVTNVSVDFSEIRVKVPISYKNRNYAGTIFGGSLFSATDPIYMIQLVQLLGRDYIVWDKSSIVKFKRPANSDAFAVFGFTNEEIAHLKSEVLVKKEVDIDKVVYLKNAEGKVYCEIVKTLYIADKVFYKEKRKRKGQS